MTTGLKESVGRILETLRRGISKSVLGKTLRTVGLNEILSDIYWDIYFILSPYRSISLHNTTAKFHTTERSETTSLSHTTEKERPVLSEILSESKSGDVFYDIGANLGVYGCFVGKKNRSGQVIAFEPIPANVKRLEENFELNDVNGVVFERALSNETGQTEIAFDSKSVGFQESSLIKQTEAKNISIETSRGDELITGQNVEPPTIVKIDVEGAELAVLEGLERTLNRPECRLVYCEVHPAVHSENGRNPHEVETILEGYGYETDRIHQFDDEYFVRGKK